MSSTEFNEKLKLTESNIYWVNEALIHAFIKYTELTDQRI